MKNNLKTILFFFIFLMLFSFITYADESGGSGELMGFGDVITVFVIKAPTLPSNQSSIISPYDGTTKSEFNISWTDATSVNIELNDTGTPYNCTASNSYGIWNCTKVLGANSGNYQYWKSYGTNASGTITSDNWTFTINKALSSSYIFFNINSVIEGTQTNATCLKSSGDSSSLVRLFRSGSAVGTPGLYSTSEVVTLDAGNWIYTCTLDDSQNYSNSSAPPQTLIIITGTFTPSGGGSDTPVFQSQTSSGSFTITSSVSSITMETNSTSIIFKLANTFSYDITSISVSVSGLNSSWYTLDKTSVARLKHDVGTDNVTMDIKIPSDAVAGNYTILFTATGKDFNLNTITRQASVTMMIPQEEVPENATNESEQSLNATSAATGIGNIFTGFSIKFQTFSDYIPWIVLSVVVIAIIIFRNEVIEFVKSGKVKLPERKPKAEAKEHAEAKKMPKLAIMNKVRSLSQRRLVIQIKKKKEEKKT